MNRSSTVAALATSITTSNITLNYNALTSILNKVGDKPLCIISINGKSGKGKSLMLNFFLQYLRARVSQNNPNPSNWFRPTEVGKDFNWRGGSETETNGISIYSEPIDINVNEETIAVLLVDTQGIFDDQTSFQDNAVIFALSCILSSVMVVNVDVGISEDMLQFLHFFTGFAQQTLQTEDTETITSTLFAQSLLFLVRDFESTAEFRLGIHDDNTPRPNYKQVKLDSSHDKSTEANLLRDHLRELFPLVGVCLLPHPGKGLARDSTLDNLDPEFEEEIIRLVENIFSPENLVKKTICDEVLTGNKLKPYLQHWQTVFENDTPTVTNLTEATAEVQNLTALANADKHFDLGITEISKKYPNGVSVEKFHAEADSLKSECFALFKQTRKFGGKLYEQKFSNELLNVLEAKTENFRQLNSERVQAAETIKTLQEQNQQMEEFAKKYNGTLVELNTLKQRSDAVDSANEQVNVVTNEQNKTLNDKKELEKQQRELYSMLQNMRISVDRERHNYEETIRGMTNRMEEQARNHEHQVRELHRHIEAMLEPTPRISTGN